MKILLLSLFCLFSLPALAAKHPDCDLGAAGIKHTKDFEKFFVKLQAAAAAKDELALSKMAVYPLRVGKKSRIKDETELKKKFSSVFTPKVLAAITRQKRGAMFCNFQGARIGHGEVWIQEIEGVIVISSIKE